jgi:hypothetical protein
MSVQKISPPESEFETARKHFESWRKTKEYSSTPIPEQLWQEAVRLAGAHSIYQVSKTLGLDYNHLKRRVQRNEGLPQSSENRTDAFVEVSLSAAMPLRECTIELERPDKTRMRLSIKGAVDRNLIDLAKAFWCRS